MSNFVLFANPWWVNLLIFIPFITYAIFRKRELTLSFEQLFATFILGIAFGFIESSVIIYLRAALGMLNVNNFVPIQAVNGLSKLLLTTEFFREISTIILLLTVAVIAVKTFQERCAIFLWTFAVWDIFYYVFLWFTIRWPSSLTSQDVLFLIPVPWISQIWFPMLISAISIAAVILTVKKENKF